MHRLRKRAPELELNVKEEEDWREQLRLPPREAAAVIHNRRPVRHVAGYVRKTWAGPVRSKGIPIPLHP